MDMRQEVLRQAKEAFAEGRDEIFAAMEVINEVQEYAKNEGLVALSKDDFFRKEGEAYILDVLEEKGRNVPLKRYLVYGLDLISDVEDFKVLDALMENRYMVNAYIGKEAYIAYVYLVGVSSIAQGLPFLQTLGLFRSGIPDAEEKSFDDFAAKWGSGGKGTKKMGTVIKFERKRG